MPGREQKYYEYFPEFSPASRRIVLLTAFLGTAVAATLSANAQTLVGDYQFNNTLTSSVGSAPALTVTDPLNDSGFGTATVFGTTHSVYNFGGANSPVTDQAGLTLNTTGLITPNNYSVQLVASFNNIVGNGSGWIRLIDVQNRASDNGFYYDPNHVLDVFPVTGAGTMVMANTFEDVVLTVSAGAVEIPAR